MGGADLHRFLRTSVANRGSSAKACVFKIKSPSLATRNILWNSTDLKRSWKAHKCSLWYIVLKPGYSFKIQFQFCVPHFGEAPRSQTRGRKEMHPVRTLSLKGSLVGSQYIFSFLTHQITRIGNCLPWVGLYWGLEGATDWNIFFLHSP